MAAPMATTSSGLTPLCGSLPNNCFTTSWTFGMRVMPPTSTTSPTSAAVRPASFSALRHGSMVFWTRSSTSASNLERVGFIQPLQGKLVVAQVDALLLLELVGEIADEAHVEIFTAEEGVAVGGLHLEHAVADFKNRNVEGA